MKIAVVCANGRAGRLITEEALARGMDVTAVVRGENRTAAKKALVKDLFALTKEDLQGFDAVVDAFGAWSAEDVDGICKAVGRLCDLLSGSETRLLVVGGAGSLYVNAEHTACVAAFIFFEVIRVYRYGFGPAESHKNKADQPYQVKMRQRIERIAPVYFRRVVPASNRGETVCEFVKRQYDEHREKHANI